VPTDITIRAEGIELPAELNDSETAQALVSRLPLEVEMSRWGDEYYGDVGDDLGVRVAADARAEMSVGEIAYWPTGNAVCIFFGPTPASSGDMPVAASPVNPVGEVTGDVSRLKALGGSVTIELARA